MSARAQKPKEKTPNEAFGVVLRAIRKEKGKTQAELAFMADLDRTYISLLELGQRSPTLDTIYALCDALEVKHSYIVIEMEEIPRKKESKKKK